MPDWLSNGSSEVDVDLLAQVFSTLGLAFLCGCAIALVYRLVRPREAIMPTFHATLVLLSILCAMLPLVIGENVAWAFGLVGALSIVRFRTVVEDTHDITFVIFAVLVGMAVGADRLGVAIVGIAVTGTAAFVVRPRGLTEVAEHFEAKLILRVELGVSVEAAWNETVAVYCESSRLQSVSTTRQGASVDLTYRVLVESEEKLMEIFHAANRLDGIQSVEIRRGK